jgi:glucose-6-phosphate 1-dehydrogenase
VPEGSKCPTYAACRLYINNERWAGMCVCMNVGVGSL